MLTKNPIEHRRHNRHYPVPTCLYCFPENDDKKGDTISR